MGSGQTKRSRNTHLAIVGGTGDVQALASAPPRPLAPVTVSRMSADAFVPAPEMARWIRETFLRAGSTLYNPAHVHLEFASIGLLWTNVPNRSRMRIVLATAEDPSTGISTAWKRGRAEQQLSEWFGEIPNFLITLYAPELVEFPNREFCAVIEHELFHCAQQLDEFGAPKFRQDGSPAFGIKGHCVEEFIGVVERYGAVGNTKHLVDAAAKAPAVHQAQIDWACGTCARRVA